MHVDPERKEEYQRAISSIDGLVGWEAKMLTIRDMGIALAAVGRALACYSSSELGSGGMVRPS